MSSTITTSIEKEKPVKIYIGTPCYGGQCFAGYVASLLQTQAHLQTLDPPMSLETCFLTNESLITRGRNTIVAKFLNETSFTHLLFIDADISWHPLTVEKLVKADQDIVGAIYPKKGYTWKNLSKVLPNMVETNSEDGGVKFKDVDAKMEAFVKANLMNYTMNYGSNRQVKNNLLEVKHIGTGFMMIKREVLEKMCAKFTECKYDDDINILSDAENEHLYSLFDCDISLGTDKKLHYLSEDYLFCKRWIDMGGQIFAEVTSPLTHTGTHSFQGHYLASLRFESETGATSILQTGMTRQDTPMESRIPDSNYRPKNVPAETKSESFSVPSEKEKPATIQTTIPPQSKPSLKPKDVSKIKLI
jgi:hypothetical protein